MNKKNKQNYRYCMCKKVRKKALAINTNSFLVLSVQLSDSKGG